MSISKKPLKALLKIRDLSLKEVINVLRRKDLLSRTLTCQECGIEMLERLRKDCIDGYCWRCENLFCPRYKNRKSIRAGSFFESSKLSLADFWTIISCWLENVQIDTICNLFGFAKSTIIRVFERLRRLAHEHLQINPIRLGGQGIICQMDESMFSYKSKYNRGRRTSEQRWCFGIVDTSFTPAKGYLQLVEKRDRSTLFDIINRVCMPGTILYSDEWAAYRTIGDSENFSHKTVNHSLNFVNPETGVHTQHIESYWNRVKRRLKVMHGIKGNLVHYLSEIMWKDHYRSRRLSALIGMLKIVNK